MYKKKLVPRILFLRFRNKRNKWIKQNVTEKGNRDRCLTSTDREKKRKKMNIPVVEGCRAEREIDNLEDVFNVWQP